MAAMQSHWDIFCRVVDNYGDIGVCWRLARQLRAEHALIVRLWVDDLTALAALCPALNTYLDVQEVDGVDVRHWATSFPEVEVADVVIEAFACELPESYLQAMAFRAITPRWVNLEYLSAEAWVEGCHCLASPHPNFPLTKHFFFPGFTNQTGGLLREFGLLERREQYFQLSSLKSSIDISLFCYETAPVAELLDIWASGEQPIRCFVPPGKPLHAVQDHLGCEGLKQTGNLEIVPIPFVPQSDFDQLLWRCDINFIRGEDSFIRAQWAAKPFVWQIYPQQEEAHLVKLEAFLARYTSSLPLSAAESVKKMSYAWNAGKDLAAAWPCFLKHTLLLAQHGKAWAKTLAVHGDLASNLVRFCATAL